MYYAEQQSRNVFIDSVPNVFKTQFIKPIVNVQYVEEKLFQNEIFVQTQILIHSLRQFGQIVL
ncbi:hypothetical protein Mgra_00005365 [Meloidogyne graminicola]|uniref:Uncharacterized protein n=1 Tax=Meloidogyne graminicola TaxID=189291 RepID=A0A8S9ZPB3_9BILA|nr:hypothetical protein Mgra_00005365 [Meloidogyne graminicola]